MIAYFDCFSGISGDMILGAMVDAGIPLNRLRRELSKMNLSGYKLKEREVKRAGIRGTKVDVLISSKFKVQSSKRWKDIEGIVKRSSLSAEIKEKGLKIMRRLFEAEGNVHGESPEKVHLHELGAMDCIIDVFGAIIGMNLLNLEKIYSSPLNLGSGFITAEHGDLPVPAPATAEILKGIPTYSTGISYELTTPTGAAIIAAISDDFISLPPFKIEKIGYGAGSKDIKGHPNVLRLFIGEDGMDYDKDEVVVVETNIDDMNPQIYEHLIERLLEEGALDAYITPIMMKKNRPANLLTILSGKKIMGVLINTLFKETTTFGVRFHSVSRYKLSKKIEKVKTKYGTINVKVGLRGDDIISITPEYEDCRVIAKKKKLPLRTILEEVKRKAIK
ncbi:MAG: nickel pincer cofactor biosynthesis protein LarC [Nitrospirae bacterium]|nr:nickel pincer cofactor biosynthesis protein LarC [Nitrospirota bacterium]